MRLMSNKGETRFIAKSPSTLLSLAASTVSTGCCAVCWLMCCDVLVSSYPNAENAMRLLDFANLRPIFGTNPNTRKRLRTGTPQHFMLGKAGDYVLPIAFSWVLDNQLAGMAFVQERDVPALCDVSIP